MSKDVITDEAVIYQLEKVNQGGAVYELFEERMQWLAEQWGYQIEDDEESLNHGDIRLPDGRYAGLTFNAYITKNPT